VLTCLSHPRASFFRHVDGTLIRPSGRKPHAQVEIKNGIFDLTLSNPDGIVTGVRYNGVDNLMEILNKEDNRGYRF
jgi:hypothetical protein